MFQRAYFRTSLLALGWIPADFRSTVVVAHRRTTYNMWTSLSLLDIKPRRGSSCCLMGSPDININSGFKTASRGEPHAAQCGAAPCQASLVFSCCRLCFSSHSSRVSWWMHRTSDLTQCGLDNFAFYVLYTNPASTLLHTITYKSRLTSKKWHKKTDAIFSIFVRNGINPWHFF